MLRQGNLIETYLFEKCDYWFTEQCDYQTGLMDNKLFLKGHFEIIIAREVYSLAFYIL